MSGVQSLQGAFGWLGGVGRPNAESGWMRIQEQSSGRAAPGGQLTPPRYTQSDVRITDVLHAPLAGVSENASNHRSNVIPDEAKRILREQSESYAFNAAPSSPNPALTGNTLPGVTRLGWLKNRNKCNQFAGDVLYAAGFELPTYRMPDGSRHYVNAEALPRFPDYLRQRHSLADVEPGDLLVLDYPGTGENTAHVEIVSAISVETPHALLRTMGAHPRGAEERDRSSMLQSFAARVNGTGSVPQGIWFLQPIRPLPPLASGAR